MDSKYDPRVLEVSKTLGQPVDPVKPLSPILESVVEMDAIEPDDHIYYQDVLADAKQVYAIANSAGAVTTARIDAEAPTELTFVDVASKEYQVSMYSLSRTTDKVLARKRKMIEESLNYKELRLLLALLDSTCTSSGNKVDLASGETKFTVAHLQDMVEKVMDYGTDFVLLCSHTIFSDIVKWNWDNDKNVDVFKTFDKLNVAIQVIPNQTIATDSDGGVALIPSIDAFLVARNTNTSIGSKPVYFARRKINDVEKIGGSILESGEKPGRLIIPAFGIVQNGTTRMAGASLIGYESIAVVATNPNGIVEFNRS